MGLSIKETRFKSSCCHFKVWAILWNNYSLCSNCSITEYFHEKVKRLGQSPRIWMNYRNHPIGYPKRGNLHFCRTLLSLINRKQTSNTTAQESYYNTCQPLHMTVREILEHVYMYFQFCPTTLTDDATTIIQATTKIHRNKPSDECSKHTIATI